MKKNLVLSVIILSGVLLTGFGADAQQQGLKKDTVAVTGTVPVKDTVTTGIYITSIHDIDFKQKEYAISFWLWLIYRNTDLDFYKYIEVPRQNQLKNLFLPPVQERMAKYIC